MEHIVQFAIGIDDEAIANKIQANAEKVIIQQLQQKVEKCIFTTNYCGNATGNLNSVAENLLLEWLNSHSEEIIQRASKLLSDRMIKTKAVKEAIGDVLEKVK